MTAAQAPDVDPTLQAPVSWLQGPCPLLRKPLQGTFGLGDTQQRGPCQGTDWLPWAT